MGKRYIHSALLSKSSDCSQPLNCKHIFCLCHCNLRGEEQNREEGEMAKKSWEEGEIGGKSREEGEKET